MVWDPWGELVWRPHLTLVWRPLPESTGGAAIVRFGGAAVVYLDPRLEAEDRRAALAHELVHDERGYQPTLGTRSWRAVVAAEERRVDDEVARRLVPLHKLLEAAEAAEDFGHHVTAAELAADHEVPVYVAEQACALLHRGLHLEDGRQVS